MTLEYDKNKAMTEKYRAVFASIVEENQRPRPDGSIDWNKAMPQIKELIEKIEDKAIAEERKDIVKKTKKIAYGKDMRGRSYIDIDDFINLIQNK